MLFECSTGAWEELGPYLLTLLPITELRLQGIDPVRMPDGQYAFSIFCYPRDWFDRTLRFPTSEAAITHASSLALSWATQLKNP